MTEDEIVEPVRPGTLKEIAGDNREEFERLMLKYGWRIPPNHIDRVRRVEELVDPGYALPERA